MKASVFYFEHATAFLFAGMIIVALVRHQGMRSRRTLFYGVDWEVAILSLQSGMLSWGRQWNQTWFRFRSHFTTNLSRAWAVSSDTVVPTKAESVPLPRHHQQLIEDTRMDSLRLFTKGLAQELNNPLNIMGGVVDPIRRDLDELRELIDDEKAQTLLEEIELLLSDIKGGATKASRIVTNLINITHNQRSNKHYLFRASELIDPQAENWTAINAHATIVWNIDPDTVVHGNPSEINQIIYHLVRNSLESTSAEVAVEVYVAERNQELIIQVTDNGPGLEEAQIDRIFDPFYTTKIGTATGGLGLFEVQRMVRKHLGSIEAHNQHTGGVVFKIVMPRATSMMC